MKYFDVHGFYDEVKVALDAAVLVGFAFVGAIICLIFALK